MAFDRYDTRRDQERGRYADYDRERGRDHGRRDERGFFERAGDEISSWFGDDESERRQRDDERMGWGRDNERFAYRGSERDRGWLEDDDRGGRPMSNRDYRSGYGGAGYVSGSDRGYGSSGYGSDFDRGRKDRPEGSLRQNRRESGSRHHTDPHYQAWRQRQLDELDRDYEEYRRENQERFESDFGAWRETRQQKRGFLSRITEHMDVVGSDGETVGKVDCVKGDRVVLTKSDSDRNRHRSFKCSLIDSVEGDQVRLDVPAEEAKSRLRDEDRGFFGRDEEENQSTNLERSFAGTYR